MSFLARFDAAVGRSYSYANPTQFDAALTDYGLFAEIVASRAFRRLQDVRFLGAIDYLMVRSPNGATANTRYTRYQHSVGVAVLAAHYAKIRDLDAKAARLACACALLHDIGHGPLSHSLEPVFESEFGVNHHDATQDVILGRVPIGLGLPRLLLSHGVDPDEVISVLSGRYDPFEGFFAGPINFDTIEGIMRSRQYMLKVVPKRNPLLIMKAAIDRSSDTDRELVDQFWSYKDDAYNLVIRSRSGVLSDFVCQSIAQDNLHLLNVSDYFSTERSLFRKLPSMRRALNSTHLESFLDEGRKINFKVRRFFVDKTSDFAHRDDKKRYKQSKLDSALIV
jgi:hypothetical protein